MKRNLGGRKVYVAVEEPDEHEEVFLASEDLEGVEAPEEGDDDQEEKKDRGSSDDSGADYEPLQCKKYGRDSGPLAWYGGGSSPKKKAKLQQRTPQDSEASSSLQQRERATGGTPAPPDMIGQTSKHDNDEQQRRVG